MKCAVTIGTTGFRRIESEAEVGDGEVLYDGPRFPVDVAGESFLIVWDAALNNVRPMTQAEIDAIPAREVEREKAAAKRDLDVKKLERAVVRYLVKQLNIVRVGLVPALDPLTPTQVRDGIRNEIDGL